MSQVVSVTEARKHFGALLRRVLDEHEPVVIERAGKPEAVVMAVATYEPLRASETPPPADWRTLLDVALMEVQTQLDGRALPPPEQIIREMREERIHLVAV